MHGLFRLNYNTTAKRKHLIFRIQPQEKGNYSDFNVRGNSKSALSRATEVCRIEIHH